MSQPETSRPKISVIVPVYNAEAYIEKCLHSLLQQSMPEMEVIVVDDCSTDSSLSVIDSVLAQYPHRRHQVHIHHHPTNQGVAAARTTGMKAMTGEYMAHCDSDDWLDPEAYATMYAAAKANDADMVTCQYFDENTDRCDKRGVAYSGDAITALKSGQYTYGLWDKIIRSSIIKDNDIYPFPGINYNEDMNIIVRALCHSNHIEGLKQPLYHHLTDREGSICYGNQRQKVQTQSVPNMKMLDDYLNALGRTRGDRRISSRLTDPLKFWMKLGYYQSGDYKEWRTLWPECQRFIPKVKSMSCKERLLMWLRAHFY